MYNLYSRLHALKQDTSKWIEHVDDMIKQYNNTEHNIIQITPVEATKKDNFLWVAWHLQNQTKINRKYPELKVGDMVRVNIKPKHVLQKDMIQNGHRKHTKSLESMEISC